MATVYTQQAQNVRRTYLLFTGFFLVVIALGWVFGTIYNNNAIVVGASLFSIVSSIVSYWWSDKIALGLARAQQIEKKDNPMLWNIVENLAITAGLPMPRVFITPEEQINAFATGRDPMHAAIAVTQGTLRRLDKSELEGVLAHELSHVGNRDILVSTMAVVLAGIVSLLSDIFFRSMFWNSRCRDREEGGGGMILVGIIIAVLAPIGAMLIQFAISRRRESLADTSGVLLTRYPEGLISALQKIAQDTTPMETARDSTAHLWLDTPFKGKHVSLWHKMFMTHPPIEERIAALRGIDIG